MYNKCINEFGNKMVVIYMSLFMACLIIHLFWDLIYVWQNWKMNKDSFFSVTQHIVGQRDPDTEWSTTALIWYKVCGKR